MIVRGNRRFTIGTGWFETGDRTKPGSTPNPVAVLNRPGNPPAPFGGDRSATTADDCTDLQALDILYGH